jgi:hypothetical protein
MHCRANDGWTEAPPHSIRMEMYGTFDLCSPYPKPKGRLALNCMGGMRMGDG